MRRSLLAALLLAAAGLAGAQLAPQDPDWQEHEAPAPPPVRTTGLIALEIPSSRLRFGIDPDSVTLGADGIVRYVVVAVSPSGVVNALYEGIRCSTAEGKVYARHNPDSGWVAAREAEWQPLHTQRNARHALLVARSGACLGRAANRSAQQIVRDLRAPVDSRFR